MPLISLMSLYHSVTMSMMSLCHTTSTYVCLDAVSVTPDFILMLVEEDGGRLTVQVPEPHGRLLVTEGRSLFLGYYRHSTHTHTYTYTHTYTHILTPTSHHLIINGKTTELQLDSCSHSALNKFLFTKSTKTVFPESVILKEVVFKYL